MNFRRCLLGAPLLAGITVFGVQARAFELNGVWASTRRCATRCSARRERRSRSCPCPIFTAAASSSRAIASGERLPAAPSNRGRRMARPCVPLHPADQRRGRGHGVQPEDHRRRHREPRLSRNRIAGRFLSLPAVAVGRCGLGRVVHHQHKHQHEQKHHNRFHRRDFSSGTSERYISVFPLSGVR